jgi:hypothetical protein
MTLDYSNPRNEATFTDWPYGTMRTTAHFMIETKPGKGQRAVRTTVNPKTGQMGAPKALTYSQRAAIVDGSDGKTYIAELSSYGFVSIMQSNMQFINESIREDDPRHAGLVSMLQGITA